MGGIPYRAPNRDDQEAAVQQDPPIPILVVQAGATLALWLTVFYLVALL